MIQKKYSANDISKAGKRLADPNLPDSLDEFEQVLDVLSYWRFSHEKPLAEALNTLEEISKKIDKSAKFAKRLKRYISIRNKLLRFSTMELKNMQDIGGCRAIVSNKKKLIQIVRALKNRPEFKSDGKIRYKDYVSFPKDDGYRSYHLIGYFTDVYDEIKKIEVQVRTTLQHDWATALEIVDLFTKQSLKSNLGDEEWRSFFLEVSKQFAIMEDKIHLFSIKNQLKANEYKNFLVANSEALHSCNLVKHHLYKLKVIERFESFANTLRIVEAKLDRNAGYVLIEIDLQKSVVRTTIFSRDENQEAENKYTESEKKYAGKDWVIALVYASSIDELKEIYPNYFADSTDFLEHLVLIRDTFFIN